MSITPAGMVLSSINRLLDFITRKFGSGNITVTNQQVREFAWLAGGQFITLLLSLISIKLITSIGPEGYGRFILATSVGGMLSLAFFGPLEQGYTRIYFDYAKESKSRMIYFDSLMLILLWSNAIMVILSVVIIFFGYHYFNFEINFYSASALMIMIAVLNVPLLGMMNAMRLRKESSIIQVGERLLIIAVLASIVYLSLLNVTLVILSTALATCLSFIIRTRMLMRFSSDSPSQITQVSEVEKKNLRSEIYSKIMGYSLPFILWGVLGWVQSNGERWVIDSVMTKSDVGRYGLAASLVNGTVVVIFNIITQFITPLIFSKFSSENASEIAKGKSAIRLYSRITIVLFVVFAILLYLVGEDIIHLVSTKDFAVDKSILFVLTLGLGIFCLAQSLTIVGLAMSRPKIYLPAKTIASLCSVAFYFIGCKYWGIFGVVCAIVLVNLLYLFLVYVANRRLLLVVNNHT